MTIHLSDARLNDFVDDALAPDERAFIEAHLARCAHCRAEVEAIGALATELGSLPKSIAPARDLRAGIADRIARTSAPGVVETQPIAVAHRRRRARAVAMLAAAAVLVIATASLTRWWILQEPSLSPARAAGSAMTPDAAPAAMPVSFRSEETRYLDAIADLQVTLDRERDELAPRTIEILERNMAIIDRAISESRAALAQDPANRDLGQLVLSAYEQKLQLLQRARVSAL